MKRYERSVEVARPPEVDMTRGRVLRRQLARAKGLLER